MEGDFSVDGLNPYGMTVYITETGSEYYVAPARAHQSPESPGYNILVYGWTVYAPGKDHDGIGGLAYRLPKRGDRFVGFWVDPDAGWQALVSSPVVEIKEVIPPHKGQAKESAGDHHS